MLRLYQNTDKIIAFLMFSSVSAKYYFNAMFAFAIFNLLESAFNNQRVRSILSCDQKETRKTILDFLAIMLRALIVISLTAVILSGRGFFANLGFDLWLFGVLLVSACLGSISNLFHQLVYARGEDKKLALISTIPVLVIINPFFLNLSALDDLSLAATVLLIHVCSLILKYLYYKTIKI